jgi:hypothetical protein
MKFIPSSFVLGDEIPVKLIGFVIVLIIWGISSLVSAVNKASEQNRRRRAKLAKPVVAVRPKVVVRPPPLPNRGGRQPALPPLPALAQQGAPVRPALITGLGATTARAARPAAQPVTPAVIGQWMSQNTIRSQFLLAEVFRPPVAMRDTLARK